MSSVMRVYTNDDVVGVELGGALKNIIALGAGICDGLGNGDNATSQIVMPEHFARKVCTTLHKKRISSFIGIARKSIFHSDVTI